MDRTSLQKGENVGLASRSTTFTVSAQGLEVDVSALLLGSNGKVRSDSDLVFYNNPTQDGVSVSGKVVTADMRQIPIDVSSVVIVASADPLQPGAFFTSSPGLVIGSVSELTFTAPDYTARETVIVLAEVYRRHGGWKVRAVGQGYDSGLAGLATDYGVDIEVESQPVTTSVSTRTTHAAPAVPSMGISRLESQAPNLLAPARAAEAALANGGVTGRRAAVYLILDHDYSMKELYESFAVQAFAERVLALSVNLDDDGTVPVIFSGSREPFLEEILLDNYRGRIGQLHTQVDWGWGDTTAAMRMAVSHYQECGTADPALMIMQVSEEPYEKAEMRALLQNTATLGVFWLFVGFGRGKFSFYKNLNASASAKFNNVAFYDVSKNPGAVPGDRFYLGLVESFSSWMRS